MTEKQITDIVGLFVFLAALIFSNKVASVVGPYAVIIIASAVGASFALARRQRTSRGGAVWFFARQVGLALLLTVSFAAALNAYRPDLVPRVTVAPISLLIGFTDWPWALNKVVRFLIGSLDLIRGKGGSQ